MVINQVSLSSSHYNESVTSSLSFGNRRVAVERLVNQHRPVLSELKLNLNPLQEQHLARLTQGIHPPLTGRHIEVL